MATAKKQPSGSWNCKVFSHKEKVIREDGTVTEKRIYRSFTCDDPSPKGKRKCEAMAAQWAANKTAENVTYSNMTYGQALDEYIKIKSQVLSPSTIYEYKRSRKKDMQSLMDLRLDRITQIDIQKAVNIEAADHSPKTVRNMYGLVTAVMDVFRPDFKVHVQLPQKQKTKLIMPTREDIQRLRELVAGTPMDLPIDLAIFGPMRRSEICALDSDHINGNIVHVEKAMVMDENKEWIIKQPKSYAGDRYIRYPDFVAVKFKNINGKVTDLTPTAITHRFQALIAKNGFPHIRFHDLRHYSASLLHAMGIPDIYIMDRAGWGTDYALKNIYNHALDDEKVLVTQKINEQFTDIYGR